MIIPDLNVLIYAHINGAPQHEVARSWWEGLLSGVEPVGIVSPVVLGFVRLVTGRRVITAPVTIDQAIVTVDTWLEQPNTGYLADSVSILGRTCALLREAGAAGNLTTDAHIAAFAIEYDATVATNDADFSRFAGVRTVNPLV